MEAFAAAGDRINQQQAWAEELQRKEQELEKAWDSETQTKLKARWNTFPINIMKLKIISVAKTTLKTNKSTRRH